MTATPALALVTTDTRSPASEYTAADQDSFKKYQEALVAGGYYKLFNASSPFPRIISRDDPSNILPLSFLPSDYIDWLKETRGKWPSKMPTESYLAQSLLSVVGTKFLPDGPGLIRARQSRHRYINIYKKYQPTHDRADVSPIFLDYIARLVPDPDERHIFMQWIAHIFQKPSERPSWHVMMSSEPGVGKGFLVESILHPLLHHTSVVSSFTKVLSQFSTIVEDNLLCLLDDCKAKNEDTQVKLKSLLSEARAYCERKGLQGGMVNTYTRFILASNEEKPISLDATERRWWVPMPLVHRDDKQKTQEFIQTLDDWLSLPGSLCAVYNWFMSYDLRGFNHKHVKQSATLISIIGLSENVHAQFVNDYISEHTVFSYSDLMRAFDAEEMQRPKPSHLSHLLSEAKYEKGRPRINDKLTSLYYPKGMTLEKIRAAYTVTDF